MLNESILYRTEISLVRAFPIDALSLFFLQKSLELVWPTKFGHSISVTQFSSLITHNLSLITHHSNFHIHLPSPSNFYYSIFFTLFMDPTTVTVSDHFCFVTCIPFSSPSIFLFFSFPLPLQPCLSPKVETQTQKNVSTSPASSIPSSPVNNAQVSEVYSGVISAVVTHFLAAPTRKPKPIKISQAFLPRQDHHHSPVNNIELSDVYSGAISSVVTHFPAAPTSNNTNVTHFPILSRMISSDPRQCFPPSLSSAQVFLHRDPFPF